MRGDRVNEPMGAEELKEARAFLNMTQQELADELHLESVGSRHTVRAWEAGRRRVTGPAGVAIRLMVKLKRIELSRRGKAKVAQVQPEA